MRLIPPLETLRDSLILWIVTLPRTEHTTVGRLHLHHFLGGREGRQAPMLSHALVSSRLCRQVIARVVRWRDNLWLHVQEGDHSIEVKIIRGALVDLLPAAIDQAFECEHLRAVHIDSLANAHESLLVRWHGQFEVLDSLIHLLSQGLSFNLVPLHALSGSNLVSLLKHYRHKWRRWIRMEDPSNLKAASFRRILDVRVEVAWL